MHPDGPVGGTGPFWRDSSTVICLIEPLLGSKGLAAVRGWRPERRKMKMMDVNACIRVPLFRAISHVVKNTYGMGEDKESFSYLGFWCFVLQRR